jgi:hypothetical protein
MKKNLIFSFAIVFLVSTLLVSAANSYCCEQTTEGAWCQNAPQEQCSEEFQSSPTSCDATSFCRSGCCYDSKEGVCMENTPQKVCQDSGGVWDEQANCEIPQCSLGCCLIGDQAAFVTQTRCKRLSGLYGIGVNFRTDLNSELECLANVISDEKGACVYEKDYEKTCEFTTRKECKSIGGTKTSTESTGGFLGLFKREENVTLTTGDAKFYPEKLCTDETLGTNCAPTEKTTCVEGKDQVYFVDSCGNLANVYDSTKIKNALYWSKIVPLEESCGYDISNGGSATCGNCDYYLGSTCKKYSRSEDSNPPRYGDNICRDLGCTYEGKKYQHGETWCTVGGTDVNEPGSRHFRLVCYNGEVTLEPCAEFRQETCMDDTLENGFRVAACIVNRWQDCASQKEKDDCENTDKRDCKWVSSSAETMFDSGGITNICVPEFAPGFDFWAGEGESGGICSLGNSQCVVEYTEKYSGTSKEKKCTKNCKCGTSQWEEEIGNICSSFGDCKTSDMVGADQ